MNREPLELISRIRGTWANLVLEKGQEANAEGVERDLQKLESLLGVGDPFPQMTPSPVTGKEGPDCPECSGGIAADPNKFGEPDQSTIRQCDKCDGTGKIPQHVAENHCWDCCCARSWKALGIEHTTGKSIPEHIEILSRKAALCGRMAGELRRLRDIVSPMDVESIDELLAEFDRDGI